MPAPVLLRVVGPPGSGKTLLITSLTEALRQRGHRVASAVLREDAATIVTLPNGGRATVARALSALELPGVAASIDPHIDLLLAEGFEAPGSPAIELSPPGSPPLVTLSADLLAVVASTQVAGDFAVFGPGETHGLADLIERRLLGRPDTSPGRRGLRGLLGRLHR
jgi:molybdopterin-guanine dinucleotide biosynthesis protein